mgnify:CR=1 FL=1
MSNYLCARGVKPSEMDLFPACNDIMDEEIVPQDYTELTRKGLARIGCCADNGLLQDRAEKIRMALDTGRNDCALVRLPDPTRTRGYRVWAVKRSWFPEPWQRKMFPPSIRIEARAQAAIRGGQDAAMRLPFMRTTLPGMERNPRRVYAAVLGFVIEHHVSDWMKARWPSLWQPPPNVGKWGQGGKWDFSMNIPGIEKQPTTFDVAGARDKDEKYSGKKSYKADYHLLARRVKDHFVFEGVVNGVNFHGEDVKSTRWGSPLCLVAWINCCVMGLGYETIRKALS